MEAEHSKHDGGQSLPEDILFDVLARLPAKDLCRFRCVSKAWRALISHPTFIAAQRSHAGPHLVGVFFGASSRPPQVRVMDMDGNIVRVLDVLPLGKDDDGNDDVVLGVLQHHVTTGLIIDPAAGRARTVAPMVLSSFGYAPPSGALKVIHLQETLSSQICMIATIVDGRAELLRWRQTSEPPFVTGWWLQRRQATIDGIVYFLPPPVNQFDAASSLDSDRIAAFDLEREEWKTINAPALGIQEDDIWYITLTEHKGSLGFVQSIRHEHNDDKHYSAIIWLLIDINKSLWVKEYTIQMPTSWELTKLLGALDDGTVLLLVRDTKKQYKSWYQQVLVFYNPSIKTFTKFVDITIGSADILALYTGRLLS